MVHEDSVSFSVKLGGHCYDSKPVRLGRGLGEGRVRESGEHSKRTTRIAESEEPETDRSSVTTKVRIY